MATTAAITGIGLAAAGTAAAIKAQQMKTKARRVNYAGSAEATDEYRTKYGAGADQGNQGYAQGQRTATSASIGALGLGQTGQQLTQRGLQMNVAPSTQGMDLLNAYQPGQVAAAQQQLVLDQNAQANLGAARAGGALQLRNALGANAQAGVQAAGQLAAERAQEEQALLGAKVDQANTMQGQRLANLQVQNQSLGLGTGLVAQGNSQLLSAGQTQGQLGLGNQGQYLNSLSDVNSQQLAADLDYERRRQADQQRKAQNWFGLGQGLIGSGASILGKSGG